MYWYLENLEHYILEEKTQIEDEGFPRKRVEKIADSLPAESPKQGPPLNYENLQEIEKERERACRDRKKEGKKLRREREREREYEDLTVTLGTPLSKNILASQTPK